MDLKIAVKQCCIAQAITTNNKTGFATIQLQARNI
jgi:hypothetical protein